ncbi:MAG: hypothetical protein Kow00109_04330 [Acidobacteriota bacterium]
MNSHDLSIRLLRFHDLKRLGVVTNRATLRRWVAAGDFPPPIPVGPNSLAWRADEVRAWLDRRAEQRAELVRRWRGRQ